MRYIVHTASPVIIVRRVVIVCVSLCDFSTAKGKSAEERRSSATDDNLSATTKTAGTKKEKKSTGKKKEGGKGGKGDSGPPPESIQPPPGPLVALGRPKDRVNKRPRSVKEGSQCLCSPAHLETCVSFPPPHVFVACV